MRKSYKEAWLAKHHTNPSHWRPWSNVRVSRQRSQMDSRSELRRAILGFVQQDSGQPAGHAWVMRLPQTRNYFENSSLRVILCNFEAIFWALNLREEGHFQEITHEIFSFTKVIIQDLSISDIFVSEAFFFAD